MGEEGNFNPHPSFHREEQKHGDSLHGGVCRSVGAHYPS